VRGRGQHRGPHLRGRTGEGKALFERARAIVEAREHVAVQVDHAVELTGGVGLPADP
jgi:hypothetical protein